MHIQAAGNGIRIVGVENKNRTIFDDQYSRMPTDWAPIDARMNKLLAVRCCVMDFITMMLKHINFSVDADEDDDDDGDHWSWWIQVN